MRPSQDETDSVFSLLDLQETVPQERFDSESVQRAVAASSRLVVSCGDQGLACDYLSFLDDRANQTSMSVKAELMSPESLLQRVKQQDIQPTEIIVFLERGMTSQVLNLFAGLSQLANTVSFHCLVVVPSLRRHLCPGRSDAMQQLLDQLGESFRRTKDRSNSLIDAQLTRPVLSDSIALKAGNTSTVPETQESRLTVIRTGYVLSPSSSMTRRLKKLRRFLALTGPQLSSTFVAGTTLFSAINCELELRNAVRHESLPARNPAFLPKEDESSGQGESPCEKSSQSPPAAACEEASENRYGDRFRNARHLTILGGRRSWESVIYELAGETQPCEVRPLLTTLCCILGIQWIIAAIVRILILLAPSARQIHFDTLKPRTVREIISLYNRHSCRDIQLAGYNNGVNHFGWKFPDKTVVLTTGLPGKTQLSDASILDMEARLRASGAGADTSSRGDDDSAKSDTHFTVDAGLTLKHCIQELSRRNREFYVVPNYSWISMGTLFFVPVHGSGSQVSTLGDTIEDVLLYNGETEEFMFARRGDTLFRDAMYETSRHRLLLRLTLRVKPKSVYSVKQETLKNPSAADVLKVFGDHEASNVEIRKNRAASNSIDIRRYYIDPTSAIRGAMEMPRDGIGRVWDRLEETPIVSSAFHWFVRRFAFHVELILKHDEFAVFWKHHPILPVSKIQLRQMLRDGMTNSACAREDCICADLFMTRGNRDVFLKFISTHLPNARFNPGKQSL